MVWGKVVTRGLVMDCRAVFHTLWLDFMLHLSHRGHVFWRYVIYRYVLHILNFHHMSPNLKWKSFKISQTTSIYWREFCHTPSPVIISFTPSSQISEFNSNMKGSTNKNICDLIWWLRCACRNLRVVPSVPPCYASGFSVHPQLLSSLFHSHQLGSVFFHLPCVFFFLGCIFEFQKHKNMQKCIEFLQKLPPCKTHPKKNPWKVFV